MTSTSKINLPPQAPLSAYQNYIYQLEAMHGWLEVDLINNCFLMGEEVGELFSAIRKHEKLFLEGKATTSVEHIGEEIVDVFNYLLAIANRLDIDLESAFRRKNQRNFQRTWS